MRLNWGTGIAATLTFFVGMMAWFAVRAMNNQEQLLTEDYYQQELRYQGDIDKMNGTLRDHQHVEVHAKDGVISLRFPPSADGRAIKGTITLMRPSDIAGDRVLNVVADSTGHALMPVAGLGKGIYRMRLDWSADGTDRLQEQRLEIQ